MSEEFVYPFIEAVENVLEAMAKIKCEPGMPALKHDNIALGDVTGMIGIAGVEVKGYLAVSFTKPVILKIREQMLGEKVDVVDSSAIDTAGELTNMIAGNAKKLLEDEGYDLDSAIPVVVAGEKHEVIHKSKEPIIIIPFTTEDGSFFVEVCFEKRIDIPEEKQPNYF